MGRRWGGDDGGEDVGGEDEENMQRAWGEHGTRREIASCCGVLLYLSLSNYARHTKLQFKSRFSHNNNNGCTLSSRWQGVARQQEEKL